MIDKAVLKKVLKKIRNAADECEDGNYHDNCAALHDVASWLEKNNELEERDLYKGAFELLVNRLANPW